MVALFEHVHEQRVFGAEHHVVGHDVLEPAHVVLAQRGEELVEFFFRADFRVDLVGVGYVVAVGAAAARLENGRRVNDLDAQAVQVVNNVVGLRKAEILVKLDPVGSYGYLHGG